METPPSDVRATPLTRIVIAIGSAGLLVAMGSDAIAVLGRHTGFAFLGAIELFQVSAVIATSAAIILTTLSGRHAAVHILTEHARPAFREVLDRAGALASAATFALLCAGSIWVASDLWPTHEMTELLGLPLRWVRLIWIGCAAVVTLLFVGALLKARRS